MSEKPRHVLSISGGKDSAALALHLRQTRDIPDMEYVFMDTGEELEETYEYLLRLEALLGQEITRLKAAQSFRDYLRIHAGFLPAPEQRWCTVMLKIKPFEQFIGEDEVYSYIGIRADENRSGYVSNKSNIKPLYPFIDDGITKRDVFRILAESGLGVPDYYKWRSRSGCYFCFFQQKIEWLGLKEYHATLFEKAKDIERFAQEMTKHERDKNGSGMKWTNTWCEEGPLDEVVKDPCEIRRKHELLMKRKRKLPQNARLIDVMREMDPLEEADAFDEIMKEQANDEGCLICTL